MVAAKVLIEPVICDEVEGAEASRAEIYRKCADQNIILPGETLILTPLIISRSALASISWECADLLALISHLAERVFSGSLDRLLNIYYPVKMAKFLEGISRPLSEHVVYRLDTCISKDGLKILEVNVGPWIGGLSMSRLFECFASIPALKLRIEEDGLTCEEPFPAAMETIVQACRARNVNVIALIEDKSSWAHSESAVAEAIDMLRHLGLDAVHVAPSDLRLDSNSGHLTFEGKYIEGMCRLFPLSKLTSASADYRHVVVALQRRTIVDIMLAESWLTGCKAAFAILWDSEFQNCFTDRERRLIERYTPRTWHLSRRTKDLAISNKDQIVLKPNFGFGGSGVVCGWELTRKAWKAHLESALRSDEKFILQQRVCGCAFPSVFYSPDDHCVKSPNCSAVLGLFMAQRRYIGGYVRAHPGLKGVINVKNGAAVGALLEKA
jgi:hypothetical protein